MQVDVTKENFVLNKIVGQKSETIVVEGDMIVPDVKPDILNTINTVGNVCIYKKEVLDGKIRIDGDVNVYVIYLADNEEEATRSLNTSIDFTQILDFDECNPEMSLDGNVTVKSIDCKILNGRKIRVSATLELDMSVYANENADIIKNVNNISDIQSLENNLKINSLVGEGCAKTYAKDTLTIENIDNLAEILKVDLKVINKDIKISYNKVLGKADIAVKMMYLTEDNRIKVIQNKIPIMGFVDIENIDETNICDMKYTIKNILVKPNSVEEHSVYIEVELELYCRVYEDKEVKIIQDIYSPSENLNFSRRCVNTMSNKCTVKNTCNIREKVMVPEINGSEIYDVDVRPVIINKNIVNSKVMYEGEMELNFIFAASNVAGIDVKQMKLPFNFNVDIPNINVDMNINTEIEVTNQDFIINAGGEIEVKVDLEFSLSISNTIQINIIEEVNIDETRDKKIYSMVIYFVKSGDTLWNIAKKFRSTISDIARVNNIEDVNKIYPGQQLFIPKYIYTKKEISA